MVFRSAFILLPLIAAAQTPPPEVDQALRARVTEFFQYHVDGNFRKAEPLVADDTKDYYFGSQKLLFKSFKIDSIKYNDDFTKATVDLTCQRTWRSAQFPETLVTQPMSTTWKIENGKWVWYRDPNNVWATPMGPGAPNQPAPNASGTPQLPNVSPEAIAGKARAILQQSSVDKAEVTLLADKSSSDQVVFHNGSEGPVRVELDPGMKIPGLKVELDKTDLHAGENAILKLQYDPADKDPKPSFTMRLTVRPFNQVFTISVKFAPSAKEAAKL